jgi:hypothetical protein
MRKFLATVTALPLYLSSFSIAHAQTKIDPCQGATGIAGQACQLNAGRFSDIIATLIQAVFVIAVVIALGYLIYGAIRWIISQGDKTKVTDARNHIIAALIGLVIVFLSYFIINLVLSILFNQSLSNLELPTL